MTVHMSKFRMKKDPEFIKINEAIEEYKKNEKARINRMVKRSWVKQTTK